MSGGQETRTAPFSAIDALNVFASLLAGGESATPFYNRLAEAVCRLGSMRRAVVFVYDDVARRVRVAGSHRVDLGVFDGHILAIETAPVAGRALALDRVIEGTADDLPEPYATALGIEYFACVPLAAGGRGFGVIVADRATHTLSESEREVLWSLGKVCALALSARMATRAQVDARHLADRIDLAREIHERVVQRIFGVVMALQSGVPLPPEDQERCGAELRGALDDLREAMRRPLAATPKLVAFTLREELERLVDGHDDGLVVRWQPGVDLPAQFEPVTQSVLSEAIRNARRHAEPTRIDVRVEGDADTVSLEITNDGVGCPARLGGTGMGLRIAAFEALQHGASLNFGPTGADHWHVRLVLPRPEAT